MLKVSVFLRGISAYRHELEHGARRADAQAVARAELGLAGDALAVHEGAVAAVVAHDRAAALAQQRAMHARDAAAGARERDAPALARAEADDDRVVGDR